MGALVLGIAFVTSSARASDLSDFQRALDAYEAQDYARAATLFDELVGDVVPRLHTPALVLESRKYLGASYMFLGRTENAEEQFQRLLEQDPTYPLDPLAFPAEVEQLFSSVRDRLRRQRVEAETARAEAEARARIAETEALLRERGRQEQLYALAEAVRVERVSSRWLAMLPFGVGQFQNGHSELGYALAVGQGALATATVVSWFAHALLRAERDRIAADKDVSLSPSEIDRANFQVGLARTTNRVSFALLMTVVVVGVVDAQLRFQPTVSWEERRPLPEELRTPLTVGVGAGSVTLRVDL